MLYFSSPPDEKGLPHVFPYPSAEIIFWLPPHLLLKILLRAWRIGGEGFGFWVEIFRIQLRNKLYDLNGDCSVWIHFYGLPKENVAPGLLSSWFQIILIWIRCPSDNLQWLDKFSKLIWDFIPSPLNFFLINGSNIINFILLKREKPIWPNSKAIRAIKWQRRGHHQARALQKLSLSFLSL